MWNKDSIFITIDGQKLQHDLDWIGKENFKNPINPGENRILGVFYDSAIELAKLKNINKGTVEIRVEVKGSHGWVGAGC